MRVSKLPARPGCPSPEELAAFIDGRLQGAERERIVEHLASCEDCYSVFTGVVDFNEQESGTAGTDDEEESDDPPARVVPFPVRQAPRWQVPIKLAACLVAGVGGAFLLYRFLTVPPELTTGELLASVEDEAAARQGWTWYEATRSAEEPTYEPLAEPFMLGVYWTDLRIAALAGEVDTVQNVAREALRILAGDNGEGNAGGSLFPDPDPAILDFLRRLSQEVVPRAEVVKGLEENEHRLDAVFRDPPTPELDLGKWTAAGRLAAKAEDPTFFASSKNRRYLAWLFRQREKLYFPDGVKEELRAIQTAIRGGAPEALPYQDLVQRFERIISHYANYLDDPY